MSACLAHRLCRLWGGGAPAGAGAGAGAGADALCVVHAMLMFSTHAGSTPVRTWALRVMVCGWYQTACGPYSLQGCVDCGGSACVGLMMCMLQVQWGANCWTACPTLRVGVAKPQNVPGPLFTCQVVPVERGCGSGLLG